MEAPTRPLNVTELIEAIPATTEVAADRRLTASGPRPHDAPSRRGLAAVLAAGLTACQDLGGLPVSMGRGWFQSENDRQKSLAESNWSRAVQVLDSMSYLRGAFMKVGTDDGQSPADRLP